MVTIPFDVATATTTTAVGTTSGTFATEVSTTSTANVSCGTLQ
jgi:hypothetical protein